MASCLPIPEPPPVTMATLSSSFSSLIHRAPLMYCLKKLMIWNIVFIGIIRTCWWSSGGFPGSPSPTSTTYIYNKLWYTVQDCYLQKNLQQRRKYFQFHELIFLMKNNYIIKTFYLQQFWHPIIIFYSQLLKNWGKFHFHQWYDSERTYWKFCRQIRTPDSV